MVWGALGRAAPARGADAAGATDAAMRPLPMRSKTLERWSAWLLLLGTTVLWQIICSVFEGSEFIFHSPWAIATQLAEFGSVIAGVLLGFVIGSSRLAYAALYPMMTAFNALPKAALVPIFVVWFGIGAG